MLEVNEKSQTNQGGILTKLLISQLLIDLEYQTLYESNAMILYFYHMVRYERTLIWIFMNIKGKKIN